ncbi:hypothetical protein JKP88DRAFT_244905 [Tribonema minus]|uniref:Protein kinase domain-containing protein n=1 Tax=Tribonema minus TaxID=303371 RepID=A0A835YZ38_9STRA|nr:hypothetical protein JKP88DRAFT_244905 [Tribonema minus]
METDFLEHIEQQWQPTTALVCVEWRQSHLERHIPSTALPDHVYELRDALEEGMPLISAAIEHVCRDDWLNSICSTRDVRDHFYDVNQLIEKYADIKDPACKSIFDAWYHNFIFWTWNDKRGALAEIDFLLQHDQQNERMLTYDIYPIARAVALIEDMERLRYLVSYFHSASCESQEHFDNNFVGCDCHDNRICKVFAQAIFDNFCDSPEMQDWAFEVLASESDDSSDESDKSLLLNVLAAEAELQDDDSTVFDIADLDGAAYAHMAALVLPPYPFVLERTCIKVGVVAVPMVCACVDALLTSVNHIGSSGLELVITQEVKGRHLGPAAKKREYNAWKKKVFPAAANTAAKRHIALCSYLFRSTVSGKKRKTSDTITPPPDVEVVARKAERPHIASDLQELVDTTVKTRRYECKMDHDTISALESVFGVHIPPESRADSCTFLSNALPIGNMGYTVDDLLGNGAYGIVMNATNRRGEKCVMKLTRLYDDDDDHDIEVTFKGESTEWRSVSPRDFDYGLYIHQMLDKLFEKDSLIMMPHVADALKVNIDRDGSKVGLLIMSHVSGQPLAGVFKMHNKQLSVTTAATVGAIMKRLHEHEIVHGDAHTENFLMGDDGIVYVIDFDRTTSIRGATKSVATACMDYDVVLFLKYAPVHTWRPFLDAYGRTPAYELTARSVGSVMQKLWDRYSRYLDEQMLHVNE